MANVQMLQEGHKAGGWGCEEMLTDSPGQHLLRELLSTSLVIQEDWDQLAVDEQEKLHDIEGTVELLEALMAHGMLNEYQASRIDAGKTFGLVLGNYRVVGRIGAGAMGVVFVGEHIELRRRVAIKVLCLPAGGDSRLLQRFAAEMRAVAQLEHPNIVAATDAGKCVNPDPNGTSLHYFVMEYIPGEDLEAEVKHRGPMTPSKACDLVHQIASALAEAHRHHLVHRDIKPSNIRVTPEGQAKLLDFGLARHVRNRMTEPGTVLGTIDFMAPEQARDAGSVDIRADIYGLGGTLYWCLTGQLPFNSKDSVVANLACRLSEPPPSVRACNLAIDPELDAVVSRMMATDPKDRYLTPQAVMQAVVPFLLPDLRYHQPIPEVQLNVEALNASLQKSVSKIVTKKAVLIVDDEASTRKFCRFALDSGEIQCDEAESGVLALEAVRGKRYDLVMIDIQMPEMSGTEVCRLLRERRPYPHMKIVMVSGEATADQMSNIMLAGADDYLSKPFSVVQLRARVKAALRLKEAQDHSDSLNLHLLNINHTLEAGLSDRDSALVQARNALVLALAELVSYRDSETGTHLKRLQHYCRILAEEAARVPIFSTQLTVSFIEALECCAPLHDIGKAGLPDHILMKPGKLTVEERLLMQTHTIIGAQVLDKVARQHSFAQSFMQMAIDIARHHHERYDGQGYPDRLAGENIPLAARVVAIADVYDALRSRRVYKPALAHTTAVKMMLEEFPGHFDPALLEVFHRCSADFERTYRELMD